MRSGKTNKKEVLFILGGSGFIGKNLSRFLLKKYKIYIISKNKASINIKGVYVIKADLTKKTIVRKIFKKFKSVNIVNCSGYINHSNIKEYQESEIINEHFLVIKNIFENIGLSKIKKFIQLGSSDEYGSQISPLKEEMREYPFSTYSFAKTAATHFLQMIYKTLNIDTVILRVFLTYGPEQDSQRFIPQIIKGCLNDLSFPTSQGTQLRDFCYIDDLSRAIDICLSTKKKIGGEIINIGSGKPISIKKMIIQIQKTIGRGNPNFGVVKFRKGENMRLYPSVQKANRLLNWKPKISLEQGLKKTIEFYKKK